MKMISSTSTTSTSGVMLMSLRMPLAPPRTSIAIGHCSFPAPAILGAAHPRLDLLDHQADPAEAGLVDQPHHVAHLLVLQPAVALQHDLLVRCLVVNALQRPRHLGVGHPVLADEDAAVLLDRDGE